MYKPLRSPEEPNAKERLVKAQEIQPGDQFIEDGRVVYTVLEVTDYPAPADAPDEHRGRQYVDATVKYEVDGGTDLRGWLGDIDVPLVRAGA